MTLWREPNKLLMNNQRPIRRELIMKYTKEEYYNKLLKDLPESDFTLDIYNGTELPCEITCNKCHTHYKFSAARLIARRATRGNKNVCKKCENNEWTEKQRIAKQKAQYLLQGKKTIELVDNLSSWSARSNALWKCTKCGHVFERSPYVMFNLKSLSCPWCETHPFQYSDEDIRERALELWGTEYTFLNTDNLKNSNGSKRVIVCHNKCGFKYSISLWNFLHGQGCPKCKASHGEKKVREYLKKHNFVFQEQYVIPVNDTHLRLDFYLEEQGHRFAIEYNGIQHYQPIERFNGQKGYEQQIYRDNLKKEYCKKHNIELIVIPYNDESIINSEELAQRLGGQAAEQCLSQ